VLRATVRFIAQSVPSFGRAAVSPTRAPSDA
jgi:hypothetical protein